VQEIEGVAKQLLRRLLAAGHDFEDGRGLRRGASGHAIETPLVARAELARAFGDVEHDRGSRAVQLVLEVGAAGGHLVDNLVDEVEQLHSPLVHVEAVVIEHVRAFIVRAREKLREGIDKSSSRDH